MKPIMEKSRCRSCGSTAIVKYGKFRGVQRYWCKTCRRKFADNGAFPNMQTPIEQVICAVIMHYEGASLTQIRNHLQSVYDAYPAISTISEWIKRFTSVIIGEMARYTPIVGDAWAADRVPMRIGRQDVWAWDIVDVKTRFLLSTHVLPVGQTMDPGVLLSETVDTAGRMPEIILVNHVPKHARRRGLAIGSETRCILIEPSQVNLHWAPEARTKSVNRQRNPDTARLFMQGWTSFYNYLRPNEVLAGDTPAYAAGIRIPFDHWADVILSS